VRAEFVANEGSPPVSVCEAIVLVCPDNRIKDNIKSFEGILESPAVAGVGSRLAVISRPTRKSSGLAFQ